MSDSVSFDGFENLTFTTLEIKELSDVNIKSMCDLLDCASYNSGMKKTFLKDFTGLDSPQLVCMLSGENGSLIAVRVIKFYDTNGDISDDIYKNYPQVHGKHLVVHPDCRSKGLGMAFLNKTNEMAFDFFKTPIIWGTANDVGAISLYSRKGGLFQISSITSMNKQLSPNENVACFKEFVLNKSLKKWSLSSQINYAWPKDDEARRYLNSCGFENIQHWF